MTILNDTRRNDLFTTAAKLGREEGKGANARPAFGAAVFAAAADGVISVGAKGEKSDVDALYAHYRANLDGKAVAPAMQDEKSLKVQVSKLRQFVLAGALPFFATSRGNLAEDFINRAHAAIADQQSMTTKQLPTYDKMVTVMRAQLTKVKEGDASPLTNDEIMAAISSEAAKPGELKALEGIVKSIRKLIEAWPGSADVLNASAACLAPRIATLTVEAEKDAMIERLSEMSGAARDAVLASMAPAPVPAEQSAE